MLALLDNDDKGLMGLGPNNPPASAEPHDNNPVNNGFALLALPLINNFIDDDNDNDVSTTACGQAAAGSNAANASATALGGPFDGSNAPSASTTAFDLPVDGSNATRAGDALVACANGDKEKPFGNGTKSDSSIPPMQQSALFPISEEGMKDWGGHWRQLLPDKIFNNFDQG
jgi:hypothetical protein